MRWYVKVASSIDGSGLMAMIHKVMVIRKVYCTQEESSHKIIMSKGWKIMVLLKTNQAFQNFSKNESWRDNKRINLQVVTLL